MSRLVITVFAATFVCLLLTDIVSSKSILRITRAMEDDKESSALSKSQKTCSKSTPCAWAIYDSSRNVVDYMTNTCKCAAELACTRVDDDLSVSAYVHRCRPKLPDSGDNQLVNS